MLNLRQTETLTAFEFRSGQTPKPHSILFVGGLGDGLATTSYLADLVTALEATPWSLFSLNLTSSYQAWGLGHLDRDTDEIAQCLRYIKEYKTSQAGSGLTVLMGHSTGSQDVLHYLSSANPHTKPSPFDPDLEHITRPAIDGAIMQAPVSDRECIFWVLEHGWLGKTPTETRKIYDEVVAIAKDKTSQQSSFDDILPLSLTSQIGYSATTPLSARRFLSLVSPESPLAPREDDMFSSDLGDEQLSKTFGLVRERELLKGKLLVLSSGADQSVPSWVDKDALLARWRQVADGQGGPPFWDEQFSGVVPNASHALSNDDQAEPRKDLNRRVLGFLTKLQNS